MVNEDESQIIGKKYLDSDLGDAEFLQILIEI